MAVRAKVKVSPAPPLAAPSSVKIVSVEFSAPVPGVLSVTVIGISISPPAAMVSPPPIEKSAALAPEIENFSIDRSVSNAAAPLGVVARLLISSHSVLDLLKPTDPKLMVPLAAATAPPVPVDVSFWTVPPVALEVPLVARESCGPTAWYTNTLLAVALVFLPLELPSENARFTDVVTVPEVTAVGVYV